jgi:hypothetical protein
MPLGRLRPDDASLGCPRYISESYDSPDKSLLEGSGLERDEGFWRSIRLEDVDNEAAEFGEVNVARWGAASSKFPSSCSLINPSGGGFENWEGPCDAVMSSSV